MLNSPAHLAAGSSGDRLWRRLRFAGPYAPLLLLFLLGLPLLSLSRLLLMLWQHERVAATGIWPEMLLQGVRIDVIELSLLALLPLCLAPLFALPRLWRLWRFFMAGWVTLALALLVLLELASPAFIGEYDARPNRLFVEYLKYPGEVFSMLWGGFRLHLIVGSALTALAVALVFRLLRPWRRAEASWSWSAARLWLTWPLILFACLFAIRSSLEHRAANPAMFALSEDPMVNSLILNSAWSVKHAIYAMRHEARSSEIYGKLAPEEILAEVSAARAAYGDTRRSLASEKFPTLIEQPASRRPAQGPLNLVIVLEESLGATFVESLGGVPVTPELEKLKGEGWWFERLYATGTRSIRGIEAVVTGFLPTPAQAVVKLSLAQRNFSTLAGILAPHGYKSEFVYGGEAHFDNMRAFFTGNGFSRITDENDYAKPLFMGSWGVSDEDLFNKAHERLLAKHAAGEKSFTLIFSSSNHAPFEFPDGRIELYETPKATENNAVKYADWALGRFIRQAKASPYWQDTLFLIVADHDIRVRGDSLVPIERFHIPGLFLGAGLEARRLRSVVSQIDLAPTALSLMGIDSVHPMPGRDLTREADDLPGRAMMQYENNYAWMEGNAVTVLRPGHEPSFGRYDEAAKRLQRVLPPEDAAPRARRALAHALLPAWLYRDKLYRLPKENPPPRR